MYIMRKMMNKKGFTLVELMIVVVILGILVAIAVPIFSSVTKNAKKKACASNIRIIEGNCSTYLATGNNGEPFGKGASPAPTSNDDSFKALFKGNELPKCMSKGGTGTPYIVTFDVSTDAPFYTVKCADSECPNYVAS
jgi:prepilin-type N-terminal cleavage/methylation domain-containing protein